MHKVRACLSVWRKIGASDFVLDVLENGFDLYKMSDGNLPGLLHREHGRTEIHHPAQAAWLREEVERKCAAGTWTLAPEEEASQYCLIKAFVIPKPRKENAWRDVWDQRPVNKHLHKKPFKFETLETVARMMGRGWFFATLDLKDAYHHIGLSPRSQRFCAFRWLGKIIVSLVLNFGLSLAPWLFTKVMRTPVTHWRRHGISVVLYLDDLIVMAPSRELLQRHMDQIKDDLEQLGLTVNWEKSHWEPTQRGEYLGVVIDTLQGTFEISQAQLTRLERELKQFAQEAIETKAVVPARAAARMAGRIICWNKALPQAALVTHKLFTCLKSVANRWESTVAVSEEALHDLKWLQENLRLWNGRSMWKASRLLVLSLTTDASDLLWAGEMCLKERTLALRGQLPEALRSSSSTLRELYAVHASLKEVAPLLEGHALQVRSDSMAAVWDLKKTRAGNQQLWQQVRAIWELALQNGFELAEPRWIPRELNALVDSWTRPEADTGDWSAPQELFGHANEVWGPLTYDRFATEENTKCSSFSSRWFSSRATATDAFTQNWSSVPGNWLCPPLPMVGRTLQHLIECRAAGVLVYPVWQSQWWWPLLLRCRRSAPVSINPRHCLDGPSGLAEPKRVSKWCLEMALVSGAEART